VGELLTMRAGSGRAEPLWRDVAGEVLRERRHERCETLSDTAGRAGVSTQYLSEVERGRKDPSSEVLSAVAGALDLTLLDLAVGVARRLHVAPGSVVPNSVAPVGREVGPVRGPLALAA
jgi:DNA-binding XRE family transcriptional regulator